MPLILGQLRKFIALLLRERLERFTERECGECCVIALRENRRSRSNVHREFREEAYRHDPHIRSMRSELRTEYALLRIIGLHGEDAHLIPCPGIQQFAGAILEGCR